MEAKEIKESEELRLKFGVYTCGEVFWSKLEILTKEGWLEKASSSLWLMTMRRMRGWTNLNNISLQ